MFIRTSNQQPALTMLFRSLLLLLPVLLTSAQDVIITKTITSRPGEATATASADAAEFTSASLFTSAILNSTNTYRDQHNASHLVWNRTLEAFANRYLGQVVSRSLPLSSNLASDSSSSSSSVADLDTRDRRGGKCDFKHSGGPYGENLALGCSNATSCVKAWGNERREYDFGKGDFGESTGHFTQLVWKDTTSVGCGARMCGGDGDSQDGSARGWYLVCEYWPRGNVIGKFTDEVQAQEGAGSSISSRVPVAFGLMVGLVCSVLTTLA
ncbi:hypothetical protein PG996_008900 [Apiospora saccharicola]|uniref:SCP domain-containing protein n=1 Tax=Apiospora saccharicola TaxID=335842 RepID=A0ABR1V2L5_9PEZI